MRCKRRSTVFIFKYRPCSHYLLPFSGVFVSLFAPLALSCDLLALRGLTIWRKALMLPWLVLYAILVALVMAVVLTGTFHYGFHWRYILLGLCCLCFFSAWRQVRLQYSAMALPRWGFVIFLKFRSTVWNSGVGTLCTF